MWFWRLFCFLCGCGGFVVAVCLFGFLVLFWVRLVLLCLLGCGRGFFPHKNAWISPFMVVGACRVSPSCHMQSGPTTTKNRTKKHPVFDLLINNVNQKFTENPACALLRIVFYSPLFEAPTLDSAVPFWIAVGQVDPLLVFCIQLILGSKWAEETSCAADLSPPLFIE